MRGMNDEMKGTREEVRDGAYTLLYSPRSALSLIHVREPR